MNEKEEKIRKAVQGVWVLESRKLPNGKALKPPEVSGVMVYTPKYSVSHFAMNVGYASAFEEYTVSGSKIIVRSLSVISSNPKWGEEPKSTTTPETKEIEARIEGNKVYFRGKPFKDWKRIIFEGDKCTNTEERFIDTYKRVESFQ